MPACRSCHAPVFFVRSAATGRNMILDAQPVPDGNIILTDDLLGQPVAQVLGPAGAAAAADEGMGALYVDHHATCPDAEAWR